MKIMNIVIHPDLEKSRVNRAWKQQLEDSGKIHTSRDLYAEAPNFKIDVTKEQELLLAHDRIVFQFPMYWFSSPPLLKQWLDDVLTYDFAYGSRGDKLKGKDLQLILSAGDPADHYEGYTSMHNLLRPFHVTAEFCQMNYLPPVCMYATEKADDATIREHGEQWINIISDPTREPIPTITSSA